MLTPIKRWTFLSLPRRPKLSHSHKKDGQGGNVPGTFWGKKKKKSCLLMKRTLLKWQLDTVVVTTLLQMLWLPRGPGLHPGLGRWRQGIATRALRCQAVCSPWEKPSCRQEGLGSPAVSCRTSLGAWKTEESVYTLASCPWFSMRSSPLHLEDKMLCPECVQRNKVLMKKGTAVVIINGRKGTTVNSAVSLTAGQQAAHIFHASRLQGTQAGGCRCYPHTPSTAYAQLRGLECRGFYACNWKSITEITIRSS